MRRTLSTFAGASAFITGLAFQILGYQSVAVGITLIVVGVGLFLLGVYPKLMRVRLRLAPTVPGVSDERLVRTQTVRLAELWPNARTFLRAAPRTQLLIYAPSGVWETTAGKRQWFGTIATCLLIADPDAANNLLAADLDTDAKHPLQVFYGVFGLPRKPRVGDASDLVRFGQELDATESLLAPLSGIETAHLRYLETDVETLPGTGAIVIDKSNVAFAFAVTGRYLVDYVVFMLDVPEIGQEVSSWFHNHTLRITESNILQDLPRGVTLSDGFSAIRDKYGV